MLVIDCVQREDKDTPSFSPRQTKGYIVALKVKKFAGKWLSNPVQLLIINTQQLAREVVG
jgi:hypothetical protein